LAPTEILINVLSSLVKSISEAFYETEFTGKSSANNSKQYRKPIQEDSERSYNQYILFKIPAAACHESGFWRVHFSARLLQRACRTRYFIT